MRKLRYCCSATYVAAHPELVGWYCLFSILKHMLVMAGMITMTLVIGYLMAVQPF